LHSHVWLFQGAEGGKWLQELKENSMQKQNVLVNDPTTVTTSDKSSTVVTTDVVVQQLKKARYL